MRGFSGMSRLASVLGPEKRTALSRDLFERSVTAAQEAEMAVVTISSADDVRTWSIRHGVELIDDPGLGLSAAADAAVSELDGAPWLIVHPDLPFVSASALGNVSDSATDGTVLVPSQDGGTNVIASTGPFPFAYGPGSFHRHLAAAPDATVVSIPELSIDLDTPAHLAGIRAIEFPPSLLP